jgi:hypothetical protein
MRTLTLRKLLQDSRLKIIGFFHIQSYAPYVIMHGSKKAATIAKIHPYSNGNKGPLPRNRTHRINRHDPNGFGAKEPFSSVWP